MDSSVNSFFADEVLPYTLYATTLLHFIHYLNV